MNYTKDVEKPGWGKNTDNVLSGANKLQVNTDRQTTADKGTVVKH